MNNVNVEVHPEERYAILRYTFNGWTFLYMTIEAAGDAHRNICVRFNVSVPGVHEVPFRSCSPQHMLTYVRRLGLPTSDLEYQLERLGW